MKKTSLYTLAVLATYGVGSEARKKKIDGLILSNFKGDIKPEKAEGVALCYGLNRGYTVFSNRYKLRDTTKIVKFELNSQLDYYTIESIYQYSMNHIRSQQFDYLDYWCPKLSVTTIPVIRTNGYMMLDIWVVGRREPEVLSAEYHNNLFQTFFRKGTESYFSSFLGEVIKRVYSDTKKEIAQATLWQSDYRKQMEQLQKEKEQLQREIIQLQQEKAAQHSVVKSHTEKPKIERINITDIVSKPKVENFNKTEFLDKVFEYNEMTKEKLYDMAKSRNLSLNKKTPKNDIIKLLMLNEEKEISLGLNFNS